MIRAGAMTRAPFTDLNPVRQVARAGLTAIEHALPMGARAAGVLLSALITAAGLFACTASDSNPPAGPSPPGDITPGSEWRGLKVADEDRCSLYDEEVRKNDYTYPPDVEEQIVKRLGGIFSPYTCETFDSTQETQIEHVVALAEAHDSGLCSADRATRQRFARDLRNLTLAGGTLNQQKGSKDANEWLPAQNWCWFAQTIVEVRLAYGLTIDKPEVETLERILSSCSATAIRCDASPG